MISHSLLWYSGSRESIRRNTDIPNNQREEIEYTEHAKERMEWHNLTPDHVAYALASYKEQYTVRRNGVVYASTLPDGRNIKVRVQSDPKKLIVVDAFTYV